MKLFKLIFDWWYQATLGTKIFTFLRGEFVGVDKFGNRYFQERGRKDRGLVHWDRRKRWAIYKGLAEASAIPPEWNAWLQHTESDAPLNYNKKYNWEKTHKPNLTGTDGAYRPSGSILSGERDKATGDYEHWRPKN
ncbi:NADH:ubiquinone oxidoreductase subunit NDUFA12 [Alphaproteobacteria bacterium]|nr:NADH:ubiquinone oxidoreductase subunit NDUFA12 [Alphaproteobacteria bacterium]